MTWSAHQPLHGLSTRHGSLGLPAQNSAASRSGDYPLTLLTGRTVRDHAHGPLALHQQRELFRRWATNPAIHPHEALLGILALLHGATSSEVRHLRLDHIDPLDRTIRLGVGPPGAAGPGELDDPAALPSPPPSQAHRQPASDGHQGYKGWPIPSLERLCRPRPGRLRRPAPAAALHPLVDLVNTMDPKLAAAVFGMDAEGRDLPRRPC